MAPMSPNNYYLPSHPTTLLTPTSSISSLGNGVTSPPPTLQGSPLPLSSQPPSSSLVSIKTIPTFNIDPQLTVETASAHLQRGAAERPPDALLRPSVYIH